MLDTIIVGAGLFGSIIAAHLRRLGQQVLVIDSGDPLAGSRAAGCVLNPAWMTNMSKAEKDAALLMLDELYGLRGVRFEADGTREVLAWRVEPGVVMALPGWRQEASVTEVTDYGSEAHVKIGNIVGLREVRAVKNVVVATGRLSAALCPWAPSVSGRTGWSYRAPPVEQPTIRTWAPYRQVVAFNMDDGRSWRGDGCAYVDRASFLREMAASQVRCLGVDLTRNHAMDFIQPDLYQRRQGIRPYSVAKLSRPCIVETQGRVTCVTGGGKNGTAAAAWAAAEVAKIVGAA